MRKNYFLSFLLVLVSHLSFGQIVINEIDADQTGTDVSEFIELKWTPNTSLDGYVVVLFNGSDDRSYSSYDLDGKTTDANGFFILATTNLATGSDIDMGASNAVQNGADAVAVYQANDTDFPNDTDITLTNLVDVIVYGTSDSNDNGLLTGFNKTVQYDENLNGSKDTESIQRHSDGTYQVLAPTFRAENNTSSEASLSITSPSDNSSLAPGTTEVNISISVGNFNVAPGGTGDGYIKYIVNSGSAVDKFDTADIALTSLTPGSYAVTVELVDNSGASLSPAITATVNFTIASFTQVANLAALRAGTEGDYYELTGEVILTYARSSRNQKYIQDASAGILIDDTVGTITTAYNTYDGISGLKGRLGSFGGVLQFVPSSDPGAASSTGNTITPEVVSLADFEANAVNYESELITVQNVSFTDAGGTFASSTSYEIMSGGTTSTFRTNFSEADYIGTTIPSGTVDITALGASFTNSSGTTNQIVAIDLSGIVLGLNKSNIEGFAVYPNPVESKTFKLSSASFTTKTVQIFNVLGKEVYSTKVNGTNNDIDVASLNAGIYILKVLENGRMASKKLIIK
ncbi:hypothetical protein BTO06_16250 [Tenacibaculum sp. SZ-18]|uniref:T9SS type A sorting domain-containing protein n=1 Tax=Tenacibaculum sp. SZ-18 TaxID=754423 RepID=UPI000C2D5A03|nr:T9SS type A sorting domain-containing protein [Tenacibaculum sp. SZ-18]AUC16604.1 hypothetical protein BTO06_16250 [Tenacibaculum sp. SZ-18]